MRGNRQRGQRSLRPTVGLDEPCRECGEPIYYNYQGPVAGLCGKCTDGAIRRHPGREMPRTVVVHERGSRAWIWVLVLMALALGAAGGLIVSDFLRL
ncbi:MAG: hypothetical protein ACYTEZ_13020 [Planctomycetota bacterium]